MNLDPMTRPFQTGDVAAAKRIVDAAALFPSDMLDEMMAAYLDGGASGEFWLAAGEAEAIGIAYCAPERMTDGTWNLYLIAVHPDDQRQGHGAALIHAVERRVLEASGRVLLIETSGLGSFAGQRAFYKSLGYHEEARVRDFYQAGEDKVVFWKALA